jgi:hypothetical protein
MDMQRCVLFSIDVELKRENTLTSSLPICVSGRNKLHKVCKLLKTVHYVTIIMRFPPICYFSFVGPGILHTKLFSVQSHKPLTA